MPHWTTPKPSTHSLTTDTANAITALQGELDKLFDQISTVTTREIDAVAKQVTKFYSEFESHLADARKKLAN